MILSIMLQYSFEVAVCIGKGMVRHHLHEDRLSIAATQTDPATVSLGRQTGLAVCDSSTGYFDLKQRQRGGKSQPAHRMATNYRWAPGLETPWTALADGTGGGDFSG